MRSPFLLAIAFALAAASAPRVRAELTACKFNFGMSWQGPNYAYPAQLDYVTLWSGGSEDFNAYWDGAMLAEGNVQVLGQRECEHRPIDLVSVLQIPFQIVQRMADVEVHHPAASIEFDKIGVRREQRKHRVESIGGVDQRLHFNRAIPKAAIRRSIWWT